MVKMVFLKCGPRPGLDVVYASNMYAGPSDPVPVYTYNS